MLQGEGDSSSWREQFIFVFLEGATRPIGPSIITSGPYRFAPGRRGFCCARPGRRGFCCARPGRRGCGCASLQGDGVFVVLAPGRRCCGCACYRAEQYSSNRLSSFLQYYLYLVSYAITNLALSSCCFFPDVVNFLFEILK